MESLHAKDAPRMKSTEKNAELTIGPLAFAIEYGISPFSVHVDGTSMHSSEKNREGKTTFLKQVLVELI